MRWFGHGMVAIIVAATIVGCGGGGESSGTPDGQPSPDSGAEPTSLQRPGAWLLALRVESDDEYRRAYASFHPESGELVLQQDGRRPETDTDNGDLNTKHAQLVSADSRWYLDEIEPDSGVRDSGVIELYDLLGGSRSVDLRELTGDIRLEPEQVVFDGTDPNLLHVFSSEGVIYTIDLLENTATRQGQTPAPEGYQVFNQAGTGTVLTVNAEPDERSTVPEPQDGNPERPRGLVVDEDDYPELPDGSYSLFETTDGTVWAFGVEGDDRAFIRAYRIAPGAQDWERLPGEAPWQSAGIPDKIDWIRPPLD